MKNSTLAFIKRFHELAELINKALSGTPEFWEDSNAKHDELGKTAMGEMVTIFDKHILSLRRRHGIESNTINGSIFLMGNKPYLYSSDGLGLANTYSGMTLFSNFSIELNLGINYLISQISLFLSAFLFQKWDSGFLKNYLSKVIKAYKQNQVDAEEKFVKTRRYTGEPINYVILHTALVPEWNQLQEEKYWNNEELEFMSGLKELILAFIIAHEFSHLVINTGHDYGHPPLSSELNSRTFLKRYNIPQNYSWTTEFACDANALQLCSEYLLRCWPKYRLESFLNNLKPVKPLMEGHKSLAASWAVAQAFFYGLSPFIGKNGSETHPANIQRINFLAFDMVESGVPDSIINFSGSIKQFHRKIIA